MGFIWSAVKNSHASNDEMLVPFTPLSAADGVHVGAFIGAGVTSGTGLS